LPEHIRGSCGRLCGRSPQGVESKRGANNGRGFGTKNGVAERGGGPSKITKPLELVGRPASFGTNCESKGRRARSQCIPQAIVAFGFGKDDATPCRAGEFLETGRACDF